MTDALEGLRRARTAGAGWGYRAGEASRVEPTVYALLALHAAGVPLPPDALSWLTKNQNADGSWGGPHGPDGPWVTALPSILFHALGKAPEPCARAETWLLEARSEVMDHLVNDPVVTNGHLLGWPWTAGTFGWVEPTAHAVTALRIAGRKHARVEEAIRFLNDRRCEQGGWNYGTPRVRDIALPPYPYTTAQALVALATPGTTTMTIERDFEVLMSFLHEPLGIFDLAWIAIALDANGRDPGPVLARLAAAPQDHGGWEENVHALAIAALARTLPKGRNPFRVRAA